jgi:hypothetical protein
MRRFVLGSAPTIPGLFEALYDGPDRSRPVCRNDCLLIAIVHPDIQNAGNVVDGFRHRGKYG